MEITNNQISKTAAERDRQAGHTGRSGIFLPYQERSAQELGFFLARHSRKLCKTLYLLPRNTHSGNLKSIQIHSHPLQSNYVHLFVINLWTWSPFPSRGSKTIDLTTIIT